MEEGPFPFLRLFCDWGFAGLTPIVSMNLSVNPMSKQREFSFEVVSATGNFNKHQDMTRNATIMAESGGLENSTTLEPQVKEQELRDGISYDISISLSLSEDENLGSQM